MLPRFNLDDLLARPGAESDYVVVRQAAPAAGAEHSIIVPAGELWEVLSIRFDLVTDVTVATRIPTLETSDGETVFARIPATGGITASSTGRLTWTRDVGYALNVASGGGQVNALPPLFLQPGWRIATSTIAMVAGDQYGAAGLYVRKIAGRGFAAQVAYELAQMMGELDQLDRAGG